jgi:hypothetical protein
MYDEQIIPLLRHTSGHTVITRGNGKCTEYLKILISLTNNRSTAYVFGYHETITTSYPVFIIYVYIII